MDWRNRGCIRPRRLRSPPAPLFRAQDGPNWKLCVFDDEVVQVLKVRDYVHKQMEYRGYTLADFKRIKASVEILESAPQAVVGDGGRWWFCQRIG